MPVEDAAITQSTADLLLLVGTIGRPHGVRGDVKVVPETDDVNRLAALERIFIGKDPESAERRGVENVRVQQSKRGPTAVIKMTGTDTREAADVLRNQLVFASAEDLPPLGEDECFLHDLVGLKVAAEDGEDLGLVKDVMQLPAHDVLVITRAAEGDDLLIPNVDEFASIDLENGLVVVHPIEGLLE